LPEATPKRFNGNDRAGPSLELLKVLLKLKCTENDVASKLVASSKNLEQLATSNNADMMCMQGWRYDVFGKDAERLMNGELAMVVNGKTIELKEVS
ncbi:MAG: ribonuclease D, partial [Sphingomonadales bacterium]|nr:ribonuclease D [Sphingomonadales bacterium]